jgi:PAS domain S-box-containing protein
VGIVANYFLQQKIMDPTTFILGVGIILSGVMASFSLLLSDQILKPISKLKTIVKELERGNFDTKIQVQGNNEIISVIKSFKNLQHTLADNKKITISYEKKLKKKLQERNDLQNALDKSSIVAMTDREGTITYANDKFCEISKYSREELIGQNHRMIKSDYHPPQFYENLWKTISSGEVWSGDIKNITKDGSYYWVKTTIVPFIGIDGKPEQYIAMRMDITKQKKTEEKLKDSLEDIRTADKMKDEFSTMVSHELKTPLTPIKFNTEMLLEPGVLGPLNQEQTSIIKDIEENAIRLESLISESKNLLPSIQEKGIELEIENSYDGEIVSDENRIQQVMENLIRNSIDFVPEEGGKISIKTQISDDFVIFCVQDNGIGIPKDKQKNLFQKFYQVDTSHTRKHGGTGLGLVICKGFVEGLGGEIWCESEEEKRTTFSFTIPKKQEIQVIA